jgi:hypothetical protein
MSLSIDWHDPFTDTTSHTYMLTRAHSTRRLQLSLALLPVGYALDFCGPLSTLSEVSDQASVKQELTPIFERFREELDFISAFGDTAVYDALEKARLVLSQYRTDLPKLRKRIIIVSDGEDTSSKIKPRDVCIALRKGKIRVDSVQVGEQHDPTLHAISVATGMHRLLAPCPSSQLT